jgi:tRNA dimethylallyltransferase
MNKTKLLVVIAGPTAVGKTELTIRLAKHFKAEIISADSRQFYKGMSIGTAAPTSTELLEIKHHFISNLDLNDYYNVSIYEQQALQLIESLHLNNDIVFVVGGSGLYINALCHGIDDLPDADIILRNKLNEEYLSNGLEWLQKEVQLIDPEYYKIVDRKNPKRLLRALEVCQSTGKTYTELRTSTIRERPFKILKIGLNISREVLFERINIRVDNMIEQGLIKEVQNLLPFKNLNSLNTVGYKEIFDYLDHKVDLAQAIENIKTNTRRYAKRQITWFKKDPEFQWYEPNNTIEIFKLITQSLNESEGIH